MPPAAPSLRALIAPMVSDQAPTSSVSVFQFDATKLPVGRGCATRIPGRANGLGAAGRNGFVAGRKSFSHPACGVLHTHLLEVATSNPVRLR